MKINMQLVVFLLLAVQVSFANSDQVLLQNATATFSQSGGGCPCEPHEVIDGNFEGGKGEDVSGWTIAEPGLQDAENQTIVFETGLDLTASRLTFTLYFNELEPVEFAGHFLGRFRFSVTQDNRATFADGLSIDGDVSADWQVLPSPVVCGPPEIEFEELGDNSVLAQVVAGQQVPLTGFYTVTYSLPFKNITGIRLEVLEHESLPLDGPGLFDINGNFILSELAVDANLSSEAIVGDINNDESVNLLDVSPFVALLETGNYQYEGDINQDCRVDLLDVGPFIELISGN